MTTVQNMVQSSAMKNETTITTNDQSKCQFTQKKTELQPKDKEYAN